MTKKADPSLDLYIKAILGRKATNVVALDVADYDPDTGGLVVQGKRRKERMAYLTSGAALAMGDWLEIQGDDPGPLFWPIGKGGAMTFRRPCAYDGCRSTASSRCGRVLGPRFRRVA